MSRPTMPPPFPGFAPMPPAPIPPLPPHPDLYGDPDRYSRKEVDDRDAETLASAKRYADGKYTKPETGIPSTDLSSGVQASLAKADTALQEHQSLSGYATEEWVGEQGFLTQHQDITGKVDKSALFDNPDTNPKVKSALLPSYVDDVLEYASVSAFPATGETGKIYVALDTNNTYRWGGTEYVQVGGGGQIPVAPSTDQSASGKPADAKATGDALAGKASAEQGAKADTALQGAMFPNAAGSWPINEYGNVVIPLVDDGLTDSHPGLMAASDKFKLDHLGTASEKDVPASGNASAQQVVMGNDSRLSDARTPTQHGYTTHGVGGIDEIDGSMLNVGGEGAYASTAIAIAIDDMNTTIGGKADASSLSDVATTGDYGDLLNKPTIPSAQVNADWNAASGVAQILNKPTIPDVSGKADSAAIAPAFSASSTYAVGDYVTREGLLYKCTTAVSTAGAWDSTKWSAVAVVGEMGGGGTTIWQATVTGNSTYRTAATATGNFQFVDGTLVLLTFSEAHNKNIPYNASQLVVNIDNTGNSWCHNGGNTIGGGIYEGQTILFVCGHSNNSQILYRVGSGSWVASSGNTPTLGPTVLSDSVDANSWYENYTQYYAASTRAVRRLADIMQTGYVPWATANKNAVTVGSKSTEYSIGECSLRVGSNISAYGLNSFSQGQANHALGQSAFAEGQGGYACGFASHSAGRRVICAGGTGSTLGTAHDYAWGWQGASSPNDSPSFYHTHGNGTFNINPVPASGSTDPATGFYVGEKTLPEVIAQNTNYLAYASTTTLAPETAVYRAEATGGVIPAVTLTGIPTASSYFSFEYEVTVPAGATLDSSNISAWTWVTGKGLPTSDYAGKTIYIKARLDCTARTVRAECYDVA